MKKIYTLAVMLFATAFFSLISINSIAQCENGVKGKFSPIIGQSDTGNGSLGELGIAGYTNTESATFPFYFEWRKESATGPIIKTGTCSSEHPSKLDEVFSKGRISNLSPGKYTLITYDSSIPCKRIIRVFEIK